MLKDIEAVPTLAVRDLAVASKFYGEVLGLKPLGSRESPVLMFTTGKTKLLVYQSEFAGTNKATAVNWLVGDVDATAKALEQRGVRFLDYDAPGATRAGHVHIFGTLRTAWFEDPDGNIHSLIPG